MFGENFKSSIFVLPWLLLPLVVLAFFVIMVEPWIQQYAISNNPSRTYPDSEAEVDEGLDYWEEEFSEDSGSGDVNTGNGKGYGWELSKDSFVMSTVIAIIANFLFLIIIPCAIGGYSGSVKRFEFYLGFFMNLAAVIVLPVAYYMAYGLDHTTFIILIILHMVSYLATFIVGSRFVSPAYRKAFWFV